MKRHQRIKRAREELERLDIKIARVYSAIQDEHKHFKKLLSNLKTANDPLHTLVQDFCLRQSRVNQVVLSKLHDIVSLSEYGGPGLRQRRRKGEEERPQDTMDIDGRLGLDAPGDRDEETDGEDEEAKAQVGGIINFISDLATN
jgi:hypothetical protein